ncbi:alpha-galactosidase [Seonamhaeicola marinus]|uniref:Alpha-galactosidase n=1 Tax=Seonamhaeicola marinus TaxID=1912246 RepID=A0A5D0J2K5_9FLAO|nr:alpha-galactosidase [Seonamhaeicola marinus]TYA89250.1 alpha-galactosidase [Seonamhaeicola marinus]
MRLIINLIIYLLISNYVFAQSKSLIDDINSERNKITNCYSKLENDTLVMGNSFIERRFKWNNGNIISIDITNKKTGKTIKINNDKSPDFTILNFNAKLRENSYASFVVEATPIVPAYLSSQITTKYEGIEVKRIFKIFPSSMGIACEYHLKKVSGNLQFSSVDFIVEQLSIENTKWTLEMVEFIDQTDHHNTYVKNDTILPDGTIKHVGNIMYMSSLVEEEGLYFLKESPCSMSQINYPGYDFVSKSNKGAVTINSVGLGVTSNDLRLNEWVKTYSYVVGVHNNQELGKKIALRSYQLNKRILRPDRDEMIMVNTWGDRNRDTKLNEKFILDELKEAHKFGFTHYQIDDGWQQGLSMNSGYKGERLWDSWSLEDWMPNKERFPNGFENILTLADSLGIKIGLWFHPTNENEYARWEQDADIVLNLYEKYGIKNFKIDGVKLPSKTADINLGRFFDKILISTNFDIVFNLDVTADNRYGYHYNNHLGNIFLENRYTDWKSYYPYKTLRNIWMLSNYLPPQKIQLEFLNKWRNKEAYGDKDLFAPANYSFDYTFAITLPAQPLAWFEVTGLPDEATTSIELFQQYKSVSSKLCNAQIFPIGNEPNGKTHTGFQFINSSREGYILVFRELNNVSNFNISSLLPSNTSVKFHKVLGNGSDFKTTTDYEGKISVNLDKANSFCLYKYAIE